MELVVQWCSCLSHLWSQSNLSPILQIHSFIIMNFAIIINTIWGKRTFDHLSPEVSLHKMPSMHQRKLQGWMEMDQKMLCVLQLPGSTQSYSSPLEPRCHQKLQILGMELQSFPAEFVLVMSIHGIFPPLSFGMQGFTVPVSIRSMCFDFTGLMIKETALSLRTDFIK